MSKFETTGFQPIQSSPATPNPKKRPHPRRKKLLLAIAVIVMFGLFLAVYVIFAKKTQAPASQHAEQQPLAAEVEDTLLRIVATGDMIAHDALNAAAKTKAGYDYGQFMQAMQPYFDAADVRFCNQATLAAGEQFGITGYPIFNAPTRLAADMAGIGCNVINTGSNHANDKSQAALDASIAVWDDIPNMKAIAGANRSETERQAIRYFETNGIRFAFLSYTTYLNSPNKQPYSVTMYSETLAEKQLAEARKNADIVMVSMRWGTEYSSDINTAQTKQSQFLADHGADIVLGHGSHVLQPVKKLAGKDGRPTYVWYSLGNFLNAQTEIETLTSGFAVMDVSKDSKEITQVGFLPIYMHYEWTAAQQAAEDLLARTNFAMYLLEDAAEPLARSQHGTTVDVQTDRIAKLLNTYTAVPILTKQQYLERTIP